MTLEQTLEQRKNTHGNFKENSAISMGLKSIIRDHDNFYFMPRYQQEALDMIAHKISRLIAGDSYFIDTWRDIAGYAQLVVNELSDDPKATDVVQQYTKADQLKLPL